ncbi:glycosyltransferase family 8 protein [Brachyspira pilosicoli]|uniref:glycosyltransferase family 8 protein n=1 Tax=Brachyspira pilosicoli TaxID=52584 RepID=UPI003007508F
MRNIIPIVFAINDSYIKQIVTVLTSIIDNFSNENKLEINILERNLSDENKKIISKFNNSNIEINYINMNNVNMNLEKFMDIREHYNYISIETYYRFFISELFPNYDKVIYLDADIIVLEDISKLYNIDIENYLAGVVFDMNIDLVLAREWLISKGVTLKEYFEKTLNKTTTNYFNAGVLLLNLKKIREDNIAEKLWKFAEEKSPLEFQDQDVLNAVFENNVKYIDRRWNIFKDVQWYLRDHPDKNSKDKIKEISKNPFIVHYIGINKPWEYNNIYYYDYYFLDDWWKYYRKTEFYKKQDEKVYKLMKLDHKIPGYYNLFEVLILNYSLIRFWIENRKIMIKILPIKISFILNKTKNGKLSI